MVTFLNKTAHHTPLDSFKWEQQYLYQQELYGLEGRPPAATAAAAAAGQQYHYGPQWVLLRFEQPLTAPEVRRGNRQGNRQQGGSRQQGSGQGCRCCCRMYYSSAQPDFMALGGRINSDGAVHVYVCFVYGGWSAPADLCKELCCLT
jgi:hypothetical protein